MPQQSFEARAARRNRAIAERNQKRRERNPLFDQAGIIDQVAPLDERQWDALALAYDEIGRGVEHYERALAREAENQARYATYRHMLCLAIGEENVEEVEADDYERWHTHNVMWGWHYRLDRMCRYLATYLNRTPLDIFNEAQQRRDGTLAADAPMQRGDGSAPAPYALFRQQASDAPAPRAVQYTFIAEVAEA